MIPISNIFNSFNIKNYIKYTLTNDPEEENEASFREIKKENIRKKGGKCLVRNSSEKSYAFCQSVGHDE